MKQKLQISLVVAMNSEAQPLIETLGLSPVRDRFRPGIPFQACAGVWQGVNVSVTASGRDPVTGVDNVGTQAAALMTYLTIEQFAPDWVINAGTAGGMADHGCCIGEVYLSRSPFCFHDRRIPLPGFDAYGMGRFPSADTAAIARELGLKTACISTGDSLDMTSEDLSRIRAGGASIKEMEAASVAWVCGMLRVPMFAVKAVTDLIDRPDDIADQFSRYLATAVNSLTVQVPRILEVLSR